MTNKTPATIRINVVLSIAIPLSGKIGGSYFPWAVKAPQAPESKRAKFSRSQAVRQAGGAPGMKGPAGRSAQTALVDARATALHKDAENDDKQHAGDNPDNRDTVHTDPPFLNYLKSCLNESIMMMIAGPSVTRNSEGKMKRTSGKISLIVVFAAASSTC